MGRGRLNSFVILLLVVFSTKTVVAQEIALTFDDAPRGDTAKFDGATRAKKILAALNKAEVREAAFLANSERIDEEGKSRLFKYAAAGHLIGNHTHSHPDINTTDATSYVKDIVAADDNLSAFPGFWRAFRFPFLREGDELQKRDAVRADLTRLGYLNAYVTVNNYDWEMDRLLQEAIRSKRKVHYDRLRKVYLDVLLACVDFYDSMAVRILGTSPKHVILLHENDLNALFVGDLVRELRKRGWRIISPKIAYTDEIATRLSTTLFRNNPGRIGEIAKEQGFQGKLWHESCDEAYLAKLFEDRNVFE
jgi:peptidoglycan/xylan/chitin deacetylase (PgdA/CDA1 family)